MTDPSDVTDKVVMPLGPARLETDLRILFLMLNEGRYRSLTALFGLSRQQSNLASLVLLGMIGHRLGQGWHRLMSGPPPVPGAGDSALGVAGVRELVQTVAGPASRDTSMFGTLVAVAAAGGIALPVVRRGMGAVESASHQVRVAFQHRYGVHAAAAAQRMSALNLPGRDR